MNRYDWKTEPVPGGHRAYIRRVDRSGYEPVLDKHGQQKTWGTLIEAEHAAMMLLLSFVNVDMRRYGEKLQASKSAADQLFPGLVKQRGRTKAVVVERR